MLKAEAERDDLAAENLRLKEVNNRLAEVLQRFVGYDVKAAFAVSNEQTPKRSIPMINGLETAKKFHEVYERLAPMFGYKTRTDTKEFDPDSPNGRLMIAVCTEVGNEIRKLSTEAIRAALAAMSTNDDRCVIADGVCVMSHYGPCPTRLLQDALEGSEKAVTT